MTRAVTRPMTRIRMRRRRGRSQAGFTLIELMVALAMFSFAIAGVLSLAVSLVNGFREQRLAIAAESTARSAMDFVADALRGASPAVPTGAIHDTATCGQGAFTVINSATAPDSLIVTFAYGAVVTSSRTALNSTDNTLTVTDASQLAIGDTLLITNHEVGHLVRISAIAGNDLTLVNQACGTLATTYPAGGYQPGALIVRALRASFFIADLDGIPTLFLDPDAEGAAGAEPLADGIEDLQIALAVDTNGDNAITESGAAAGDDEWFHNVSGETVPVAGAIRGIRLSLIARASGQVTGTGSFLRPAAEDRPASTTPDNYRRRVLTSIIEVRNLGGSP